MRSLRSMWKRPSQQLLKSMLNHRQSPNSQYSTRSLDLFLEKLLLVLLLTDHALQLRMTSIRAKRKLPSLVFSKLYKNLFPALGECSLTILALPWIPGPAARLGHQRLRSVTAV